MQQMQALAAVHQSSVGQTSSGAIVKYTVGAGSSSNIFNPAQRLSDHENDKI